MSENASDQIGHTEHESSLFLILLTLSPPSGGVNASSSMSMTPFRSSSSSPGFVPSFPPPTDIDMSVTVLE